MKNRIFTMAFLLAVTLNTFTSRAQAGDFGLGGIVHSPTGLSMNYYFDQKHSLDGAVSTSLNDDDQNLYLHATYLWHNPALIRISQAVFDLYYGVGARIIEWDEEFPRGKRHSDHGDDTFIGPRGAIGGAYYFKRPRLQVFVELSLSVDVIPESDTDLDLAAGVRYYFR